MGIGSSSSYQHICAIFATATTVAVLVTNEQFTLHILTVKDTRREEKKTATTAKSSQKNRYAAKVYCTHTHTPTTPYIVRVINTYRMHTKSTIGGVYNPATVF